MAYATADMAAQLFELGFSSLRIGLAREEGFCRLRDGRTQTIVYTWDKRDRASLEVPPAEEVFWIASSADVSKAGGLEVVVQASERCPDPVTCFVSAEVRGWKRQT